MLHWIQHSDGVGPVSWPAGSRRTLGSTETVSTTHRAPPRCASRFSLSSRFPVLLQAPNGSIHLFCPMVSLRVSLLSLYRWSSSFLLVEQLGFLGFFSPQKGFLTFSSPWFSLHEYWKVQVPSVLSHWWCWARVCVAMVISGCGDPLHSLARSLQQVCAAIGCAFTEHNTVAVHIIPFNTQSAACLQLLAQLLQVCLAVTTSLLQCILFLIFVTGDLSSRQLVAPPLQNKEANEGQHCGKFHTGSVSFSWLQLYSSCLPLNGGSG